jgi:hypothetical protein
VRAIHNAYQSINSTVMQRTYFMTDNGTGIVIDWAKANANTDVRVTYNLVGTATQVTGSKKYYISNAAHNYTHVQGNVQLTSLSVPGYGVTSSKSADVAHDGDRITLRQPTVKSTAIWDAPVTKFAFPLPICRPRER